MTFPDPEVLVTALLKSAGAFASALLLALLVTAIENGVTRRALGLRRRRGTLTLTAAVADGLKLLSKSPQSFHWSRFGSVLAVLLPAILLAAGLPAGGGLGGLTEWSSPVDRFFCLSGVIALLPLALLAHGATTTGERRQPLSAVLVTLIGTQVALVLCVAAAILANDTATTISTREFQQWPLWQHPTGGLAFVGALAIIARAVRIAFGGSGAYNLARGLVDGPGLGTLLMRLARALFIGSSAALGTHLYLGTADLPAGVIWIGYIAVIATVGLLQAAITQGNAEGLSRLVWGRVLPLALIDVVCSLLRAGVGLPWVGIPWN